MGLTMASPSQAAVPPTLKAQLESGGFNYWKSGPANGHRAYLVRHNPNGTVRRYRIALWIGFGQARLAADLIESSAAFRRDLAREITPILDNPWRRYAVVTPWADSWRAYVILTFRTQPR